LPNDSVRAIAQTADGYLWFATADGLARFDGVNFTEFSDSNTPLLKQAMITTMLATADGWLWMGTGHSGLLRYRDGGFEKIGNPGLASASIRALLMDSRGALWIGTDGGGIARLRASGGVEVYGSKDGPSRDLMWPVIRDRHNNLWAASGDSLIRFQGDAGWVRAGSKLEFHYTALFFLFPEFTQFRFKLEGFDAGWVEAGNRRAAY
jgi:ligand-binding sensor domain-containing protein